jgi:cyclophilin family peptidyl-prolyl cis-trans isomerase
VNAGAYDSVPIDRVIPGFIVQVGEVRNRFNPLTPEQTGLDKPLRGEFSTELRHVKGTLSMARWEEPDSATSSFSILLNAAPHLDRKYTIFGHLESGGSVVDRILAVPREGERPKTPVFIVKARIVEDIDRYYAEHPRDPVESMGNMARYAERDWVAYVFAAIVALGLLSFFFYERLSKRQLLSLHMLSVLAGTFALFIFFLPIGHEHPWLAALVFVALPLLFKFMNRFESGN